MPRKSVRAAALLVWAAGGAITPAAAQAPAVASPVPAPQSPAIGSTPAQPGQAAVRIEQRVAALHKRLRITDVQEPAFNRFVQAMRDNARAMEEAFQRRAVDFDSMNAVDNLKSYAALVQAQAQQAQRLATSFEALYAEFSPEQKETADQVFRRFNARVRAGRPRVGSGG